MAALAITIQNRINCFGPAPTKWGSTQPMTWGTSKWGDGEYFPLAVKKVLSESVGLSSDISKNIKHVIDSTVVLTSWELYIESLKNGGWNYVFPSNTTNAEEQDISTWTEVSSTEANYSSLSASSTSWSSLS